MGEWQREINRNKPKECLMCIVFLVAGSICIPTYVLHGIPTVGNPVNIESSLPLQCSAADAGVQ